ncbi:MAG TPA: F420-0--gamma-glutamyl ligase [Firmicutes bacterium]|jgi:F420-0:gamma-glutamyl ligase|nr:F420-0--gamma-glutamyl ligase [Bacillota bacterium]
MRRIGVHVRSLRTPIIREGDDVARIVVDTLLDSLREDRYELMDRDVLAITESLVARAQGNYVTLGEVEKDLKAKFPGEEIGVVFPILSRNRFFLILKAIARAFSRVYLLLSYPYDEVGNPIMDMEQMDEAGINPGTDFLTEEDYHRLLGAGFKHPFTGINYIELYKSAAVNDNIVIGFANDPVAVLRFTQDVLAADIHSRARTKRLLRKAGARRVFSLDEICTASVNGDGYHPQFGLLGSNFAAEEKLKLFPRDGQAFVESVQERVKILTGKHVEVMIYGDGAFKDPVAKIWELADPVVAPAYTSGLDGTTNEIKLKYLADSELSGLPKGEIDEAMKRRIKEKKTALVGQMVAQGTTPRRLTDLLGSLADLSSGSGDKGTPVVLIQGYFDDYSVDDSAGSLTSAAREVI